MTTSHDVLVPTVPTDHHDEDESCHELEAAAAAAAAASGQKAKSGEQQHMDDCVLGLSFLF